MYKYSNEEVQSVTKKVAFFFSPERATHITTFHNIMLRPFRA